MSAFSHSSVFFRYVILAAVLLSLSGVAQSSGASLSLVTNYPPRPPLGTVVIGPPSRHYRPYPLEKNAVVVFPTIPRDGKLELPKLTLKGIPFFILTDPTSSSYRADRDYFWGEDFQWFRETSANSGKIELHWYWNGERITDIKDWLTSGSNGRGGHYRLEIWQTMESYTETPPDPATENVETIGTNIYRWRSLVARVEFQVTIKGQTYLPPGTPPTFDKTLAPVRYLISSHPIDLTKAPESFQDFVLVESVPILDASANAGRPFAYRWFRNRSPMNSNLGPKLTPPHVDYDATYHCEVSNEDGIIETPSYFIRRRRRPTINYNDVTMMTLQGGTLTFRPTFKSDTEVKFQWSGPALLKADGRATVQEDGTLQITDAQMEDSGHYTLTATDLEGVTRHSIPAAVITMPEGEHPLAVNQTFQLMKYPRPLFRDLNITWSHPQWQSEPKNIATQGVTWKLLKADPKLSGEWKVQVHAVLECPQTGYYGSTIFSSQRYEFESTFSLLQPTVAAVMPAHALPAGMIAEPYAALGPQTENGAHSATRYTVKGLPRGLKADSLGNIQGMPTQSGKFDVRFTAVNALGKDETVRVPLEIRPLPEGVAGEWLYNGTTRITILPSGAYSGKIDSYAVRGLITRDAEGLFHAHTLRIKPGSNYAHADSQYSYEYGWRNIWSKKQTVGKFAGRFNYKGGMPEPEPGREITARHLADWSYHTLAQQGHNSGTMLVQSHGGTTFTHFSLDGRVSLFKAFLGPQGEAAFACPSRLVRQTEYYNAAYSMHLKIDESGQRISDHVPFPAAYYRKKYDGHEGQPFELTYWNPYLEEVYQLVTQYHGRRYTPPAKGELLPGFSAEGQLYNANLQIRQNNSVFTPLYKATIEVPLPVQLTANGRMNFRQRPIGVLTKGKVNTAMGTFSGTVRLPEANERSSFSRPLKYHGTFVPNDEGLLDSFGCIDTSYTYEPSLTMPVTLSPSQK